MKKVMAFKSLDGKVYPTEQDAQTADEEFVSEKIYEDLRTQYATTPEWKQNPLSTIAKNRRTIREIFDRHEALLGKMKKKKFVPTGGGRPVETT